MSTTSLTSSTARAAADRARPAAYLCLAAGVLGFASGAALALVDPAVSDERFSFPLSADGFTAIQVWFAVHHLGLLAGLLALNWAGAVPDSKPAVWGWRLSVAGMVGLTLTELAAIAAADETIDSGVAVALGGLYGVDCLALGVGPLMLGAAIVHARTWTGWRRWVVLALGFWVFVPMFPALVVTPTDGARWAIGAWMLLFSALGVALLKEQPGSRQPV